MKETLDNLDIKLECNSENCADKKDESEELETKEEASNVGSNELVESLQDALKAKSELGEYTDNIGEIDDPWYTREFDRCFREIQEGCNGLFNYLVKLGEIENEI